MAPIDAALFHSRTLPSSSAAVGHHQQQRRGFSLIEAAIVLGVVGMVIGGIWVAAKEVLSRSKINETAYGSMMAIENAKKLLPIYSYPTTVGATVNVGVLLNNANAYPYGWASSGNHSISPSGVRIEVNQSCWGDCPMLSFRFYGPASVFRDTVSAGECTYLARRLINILKNRDDFLYIQHYTGSNIFYYKPIVADSIQCTELTQHLTFFFSP